MLTNWGSNSFIGLTELKVFDENYQEIFLEHEDIELSKNNQTKISSGLKKIIGNVYATIDDNNMFKNLYNIKNYFTIKIYIPSDKKISFIVFWNYNKDITIGVKNIKIFYKNLKVFEG